MKFLKTVQKALPENSIRFLLHRELTKPGQGRSHRVLHASDMTHDEKEFCPREFALKDILHATAETQRETAAMAMVYMHGHMIQAEICTILSKSGRGIGDWRCQNCYTMIQFALLPVLCNACGCKSFDYEEMRFESPATGASCGIDLLIKTAAQKLRILEIKSIKEDFFKKLVAPKAEHRVRTNLYMRLVEDSGRHGLINVEEATVLYVSKGYGVKEDSVAAWGFNEEGWSPFKEYTVTRNDAETEEYWQRAKMLNTFRKEGKMPLGVCPTSFGQRAKDCSMVHQCFSGKYPAWDGWL
jgi:hypothetical protein